MIAFAGIVSALRYMTTATEVDQWLAAETADAHCSGRCPMTRCASSRKARRKTEARASLYDPHLHHVRRL
jgi:hypothetical protein